MRRGSADQRALTRTDCRRSARRRVKAEQLDQRSPHHGCPLLTASTPSKEPSKSRNLVVRGNATFDPGPLQRLLGGTGVDRYSPGTSATWAARALPRTRLFSTVKWMPSHPSVETTDPASKKPIFMKSAIARHCPAKAAVFACPPSNMPSKNGCGIAARDGGATTNTLGAG